jgi:hypothetical protein
MLVHVEEKEHCGGYGDDLFCKCPICNTMQPFIIIHEPLWKTQLYIDEINNKKSEMEIQKKKIIKFGCGHQAIFDKLVMEGEHGFLTELDYYYEPPMKLPIRR